jgi:hypothetical protein
MYLMRAYRKAKVAFPRINGYNKKVLKLKKTASLFCKLCFYIKI